MQRTISRQHTVLSIIGFAFVLCGSLSTAEEPDTPPLAISIPDGIPHLEWFGEDPDTYYSLKAAPDLHSGEWRNVMTGRLGRGEVHEWVDTEEVPSGQRFYQLVPYTDLSGTTSDSGVFSFELEDAEKQVFVTDSDNRPLADISVQVQVDSDTFLVQVHDTSGGYFPAIETVDSEQDRLDVTMRERQLVPAGEEPAGLTFAETAHLLNQEDEYEFIPPDAQVEVLRGRDAEDLLDGLANLREPTWKNYALGGVKVGKAIEFIYSATKIIKTGTATNPIVFVATWGTFAMLDEMLKPELEKWFTRVNAEQGMVLMMSDETIEAYGNIAGTVTDGRGNRLSDFSVLIEDIPFANPLTEPGAYVVGSIPSSPGGTTYSVTVEPHSELSIYAPFFRSRRVLEGTDIPLTAWVSDVSPSTFDVTVKAATTAQGCVEISRTRRDDLTPVIKYRPIGSLDDWISVPMSSGTGFDQSSFTGSVPGSVMTDPGLEVYIEVADGEDIARTPVAQYVPATSFIAIDSNPPGAQILVNGEPAGETILSLPVEKGETLNLTAHVPDSPFPVLERTVTDTEPEHRLVMFDFVGEREISVAAPTAESLEGGSTTGITWETGGDVPYVDVLYRAGDSSRWRLIANSVANNGSIDWQVPNTDMTDVRIKVRSSDDYRFQGVSPSFNVVWTSPPPSGNEGDYLVIDLSAGPNASSYPHYFLSSVPSGGWTDEYKTTKLVLRRIPAGTFIMGSPEDELMRWSNEAQRQVTLTEDFYIGVFQVTQKQWERVMGDWPSWFKNPDYRDTRPLERRSWNDIRGGSWPGEPAGSGQPAEGTFIQKLRERTELSFDLPTEAQWEYACRAGTTTALNSGKNLTHTGFCPNMSEVGRYIHNHPGGYSDSSGVDTSGGTAKVGSYPPNAWGLYDMHGNVWEWCLDWFTWNPEGGEDPLGPGSGSFRAWRGGCWNIHARYCRSANRDGKGPSRFYFDRGFRLVRAVQ